MTDLSQKTEAIRKRPTQYDDLTRIKGIGEITQQWLRDTFGVYTFRDLASVSPVKIENRLKAEGKITARAKIEEWLEQARMLAEESGDLALPDTTPAVEQPAWKTVSTFVVIFEERLTAGQRQFQTKAHHMEADSNETWEGIDPPSLVDWLVAQLGFKGLEAQALPRITATAPPEEEPAEHPVYSDSLARHIAKVQALAGERPLLAPPGAIPAMPARAPAQAAQQQPAPKPPGAVPPTEAPYSGRLQQVIAKARSLAGEKDKRE